MDNGCGGACEQDGIGLWQARSRTLKGIIIHNSTGQLVRTLDLGQKPSGAYLSKEKTAYRDGRNEGGEARNSDVYFCVMRAGQATVTRKMIMAQ